MRHGNDVNKDEKFMKKNSNIFYFWTNVFLLHMFWCPTVLSVLLLQTVKRNQQQYDLPLKIVSYEELYGWTMDAIVKQIGLKNNCMLKIGQKYNVHKQIDLKNNSLYHIYLKNIYITDWPQKITLICKRSA